MVREEEPVKIHNKVSLNVNQKNENRLFNKNSEVKIKKRVTFKEEVSPVPDKLSDF